MTIRINFSWHKGSLSTIVDEIQKFTNSIDIQDKLAVKRAEQLARWTLQVLPKIKSFNRFWDKYCLDTRILMHENIVKKFLIGDYLPIVYENGDIEFWSYKNSFGDTSWAEWEMFDEESHWYGIDDGKGLYCRNEFVLPIDPIFDALEFKFLPRDIAFEVDWLSLSIKKFQVYILEEVLHPHEPPHTKEVKKEESTAPLLLPYSEGSIVTLKEPPKWSKWQPNDQYVILSIDIKTKTMVVKHGTTSVDYTVAVDMVDKTITVANEKWNK